LFENLLLMRYPYGIWGGITYVWNGSATDTAFV